MQTPKSKENKCSKNQIDFEPSIEVIYKDNSIPDYVFQSLKQFLLTINLQYEIGFVTDFLHLLPIILELTEKNMKDLYNNSNFNLIGWNKKKKLNEFNLNSMRLITIFQGTNLLAYSTFRFERDSELYLNDSIIYIWEIQVSVTRYYKFSKNSRR